MCVGLFFHIFLVQSLTPAVALSFPTLSPLCLSHCIYSCTVFCSVFPPNPFYSSPSLFMRMWPDPSGSLCVYVVYVCARDGQRTRIITSFLPEYHPHQCSHLRFSPVMVIVSHFTTQKCKHLKANIWLCRMQQAVKLASIFTTAFVVNTTYMCSSWCQCLYHSRVQAIERGSVSAR